jgi:hypothetical protein
MTRFAIFFLLVLCPFAVFAAEQVETPKDMVVLTVGGDIAVTNRGPLDPDRDSLLAIQKVKFERAFAFDRAMLLRLKQGEVKATTRELKQEAAFTGPLLREVLAAVGAASAKVSFVAVNGYQGWLTPEDIARSDWILALAVNGEPLGLGQQGPIWAINTRAAGEKPSETHQGHWVWSVFYMHVGD